MSFLVDEVAYTQTYTQGQEKKAATSVDKHTVPSHPVTHMIQTSVVFSSFIFFLFSFVGQLIHLEASWDVKAGHGSIDQEVHLPFVCMCFLMHVCTDSSDWSILLEATGNGSSALCLWHHFLTFAAPTSLSAYLFFSHLLIFSCIYLAFNPPTS